MSEQEPGVRRNEEPEEVDELGDDYEYVDEEADGDRPPRGRVHEAETQIVAVASGETIRCHHPVHRFAAIRQPAHALVTQDKTLRILRPKTGKRLTSSQAT